MNEKKVFTIKGSEDGILGVMTNMTKAYEKVCQYFKYVKNEPMTINDKKATQQRFNEKLRMYSSVTIECDWLSVEVEKFRLNR